MIIMHPPGPLSPEQEAVHRMHDAVLAGQHPVSIALGQPLPLHPAAAPALDMSAPGLRCSDCYWSTPPGRGRRCRRIATSSRPELRPWFPACASYEPPDYQPPAEPEEPDVEP